MVELPLSLAIKVSRFDRRVKKYVALRKIELKGVEEEGGDDEGTQKDSGIVKTDKKKLGSKKG
jgi:hypothetical protein